MMIANHLGYKVGKFCHYVHNLHVYDRHFDAAKELLERIPLDVQPSIELIRKCDFYDITINDFKINNVEDIKKIKFIIGISYLNLLNFNYNRLRLVSI